MKVYILLERYDPVVCGVFSSLEKFDEFMKEQYKDYFRKDEVEFYDFVKEYEKDLECHEVQ